MPNLLSPRAPRPDFRRLVTVLVLALGYLGVLRSLAPAQTPVILSPVPKLQFFDANGKPLAFGCVFSYQTLTTTQLATYTDYTGTVANTNPLILTSGGFVGTGGIWLQAGAAYRLVVKSAGGASCALGSTISTVDGISGGMTTLTTIVPYSATPIFVDAAQNQLFEITLTGNASAQPLTAAGIVPPGIITFQITQDNVGNHTFNWPANTIGGVAPTLQATATSQQTFIWNGTNAIALGPMTYDFVGGSSAYAVPNFYDFGLSVSSPVCTSSQGQLVSTCNSVYGVTYNGQTVSPGGSGNVNAGATAHSVAVNEGAGAAISGVVLTNDQALMGSSGVDPTPTSIPNCPNGNLAYSTSTHSYSCAPTVQASSITAIGGDVSISATTDTTWATKSVTMPSTGCPCRAFVSYGMFYITNNAGSFVSWVDDGTNQFATAQSNQTGSANSGDGQSASSYSTGTYANAANITFTAKTWTTVSSMTVKAGNARPGPQNSWLNVTIFTSN